MVTSPLIDLASWQKPLSGGGANLGSIGTGPLSGLTSGYNFASSAGSSAFSKMGGLNGVGAMAGGLAQLGGAITQGIMMGQQVDEMRRNRKMMENQYNIENERYNTLKKERDSANETIGQSANSYTLPTQRY